MLRPISSYDVIVAGAGIIGASIAWHMAEMGAKTAILDISGPAAGASGASDGALSVASKSAGLMASLAGDALRYGNALASQDGPLTRVLQSRPSFLFSMCEEEDPVLDGLAAKLLDAGAPVRIVRDTGVENATLPNLGPKVRRVVELTGEAHLLGYEAVNRYLAHPDIDHHWPCGFQSVDQDDTGLVVRTSCGDMKTRQLVVATGLEAKNQFPDLPLRARSGQLIVTDRAADPGSGGLPGLLTSASYLLDKSSERSTLPQAPVVIDPLRTGQFMIGSSREDHGTTKQTDFSTVARLLQSAVACHPALADQRVLRVFAGVRAATPDSRPIVGEHAHIPGIWFATGFEGDGICLSALIGREIASAMTGGQIDSRLHHFSPGRFAPFHQLRSVAS